MAFHTFYLGESSRRLQHPHTPAADKSRFKFTKLFDPQVFARMDDSRLPIELCERIIDLGGRSAREDGTVVDYPTLRSCALVCCAWLPRARYNLFYRVVLRTAASVERFLSTALVTRSAATSSHQDLHDIHVRELELGLPRWEAKENWPKLEDQPSVAALCLLSASRELAMGPGGLTTLVLSRMQWVYPRRHLAGLMAPFRGVQTLELYYVRFPAPGDLAHVLWALPSLVVLRCVAVYLQYARRPAEEADGAMPRCRCSAPQTVRVLKVRLASVRAGFWDFSL